jgi:hypothetical protein
MKNLLISAIIHDLLGDCTTWKGKKEISFIEQSNCYVTRYCYYKVNQTAYTYCVDQGWTLGTLSVDYLNNTSYFKDAQDLVCGTICCERIYSAECITDPLTHQSVGYVDQISCQDYPGSTCNCQTEYRNCKTNEIEPCVSGCSLGK